MAMWNNQMVNCNGIAWYSKVFWQRTSEFTSPDLDSSDISDGQIPTFAAADIFCCFKFQDSVGDPPHILVCLKTENVAQNPLVNHHSPHQQLVNCRHSPLFRRHLKILKVSNPWGYPNFHHPKSVGMPDFPWNLRFKAARDRIRRIQLGFFGLRIEKFSGWTPAGWWFVNGDYTHQYHLVMTNRASHGFLMAHV